MTIKSYETLKRKVLSCLLPITVCSTMCNYPWYFASTWSNLFDSLLKLCLVQSKWLCLITTTPRIKTLLQLILSTLFFTIKNNLSRSNGAVQVRDTAPAAPPATRFRHQSPDLSSPSVKSSGTVAGSPISIICVQWTENHRNVIWFHIITLFSTTLDSLTGRILLSQAMLFKCAVQSATGILSAFGLQHRWQANLATWHFTLDDF